MLNILNNYIFISFLFSLALSNNLVLFFISWVGLNIALYAILLKSYNPYSIEMTLKYFISSAIITVFLLLSILLYFIEYFNFYTSTASYVMYSTNNLQEIHLSLSNFSYVQKLFFNFLVAALLFKLGAFPFNFYLTELYEALCIKRSMFNYTILLKIVMYFTIIKIIINFWFLSDISASILTYSGLGSLIISSFSAIRQIKLRKIFAYSYLNSMGFVLLAISLLKYDDVGISSISVSKYFFYSYLVSWFGIWNILYLNIKVAKSVNRLEFISDLLILFRGVGSKFSMQAPYLALFISSLAGLPPFLGFFTKALVFFSLISCKVSFFILVICLLTTPIMILTYLKLLINLFISFIFKINYIFKKDYLSNSVFNVIKSKINSFNSTNLNILTLNLKTIKKFEINLEFNYLINYIFNYKVVALVLVASPYIFIL